MTRHAAAYIRRSSTSADSPGDASREAQGDAARRLAAAFAPEAEIREYVDWGISGRKDDRPEYVRLKAAITAGEVCCVFAYSLSRLGRTARELDALFSLCEAHDVQVITQADGTLTATSATGKFLRRILAELAELESELAKERSASAREAKRTRGDRFGHAPYGFRHVRQDGRIVRVPDPERPLEPIIAAYREAGSVLGACRLLEARGIPAPKGGETWATSALTRILDANAPELLPRKTREGRRSPAGAVFAHLLECPFCGRTMTPNTHRGQYYCPNGPRDRAGHPRYAVREVDIAPWIKAEADRFDPEPLRIEADDMSGRKEAIARRLDLATELYLSGDPNMPRPKYDAEKARAARDLDGLETQEAAFSLPESIEWDHAPEVVNRTLRTIIRRITLDDSLRPVSAEWTVPEWRA